MGFIGVSTGNSSIRKVFPAWADLLGLPTRELVGYDLALDTPPGVYRDLVAEIARTPEDLGALVTTHKVNLYTAAGELFDELDELATTFGEISSIYKRDGKLKGAARDPITVRLALEEFLPPTHFADTGADVLCLGSGGSGMALTHQLGERSDRPAAVICTATSPVRLEHLRDLHQRAGLPGDLFTYVLTHDPRDADALVSKLAPGSLVVNATGLGKDRPGSPLSDLVEFPRGAYVWDFNYRGSLEFLHQARGQAERNALILEDGWRYFVRGWSQVVGDVFDVAMPPERVAQLSAAAAAAR